MTKVEIHKRRYVLEDDPNKWQADIDTGKSDHHGIGRSPSEALLRAAMHWRRYDARQPAGVTAAPALSSPRLPEAR